MSVIDQITINTHSSIRIGGEKTMYFDPFRLTAEPHDADLIFFTHSHYDHFSPEDYPKAANGKTVFVCPESMRENMKEAGIPADRTVLLQPGDTASAAGIKIEAVPAYNLRKPFHPKENGWLGYVIYAGDERVYVCGDTDATPEAEAVRCEVALIPVGGTYTMDAEQAAELADHIRPRIAVPTHYGTVTGTAEDGARFAGAVDPGIRTVLKLDDRK